MTKEKQRFLEEMRANSAYPTYRAVVNVLATLLLIGVALGFVGGTYYAMAEPRPMSVVLQFFGVLIATLVNWVLVNLFKEGAVMLADISDTLMSDSAKQNAQSAGSPVTAKEGAVMLADISDTLMSEAPNRTHNQQALL
jgi:hypothetical protein